MKWNKAIEQIEKALADGKRVEVSFHRKWARNCNEYKTDRVDSVGAYDWHGETCKGVTTFDGYGLDEGNYIIDDVIVDEDQTEEPAAGELANLQYDEDGVPCITLGGCDEDQEKPFNAPNDKTVGDVLRHFYMIEYLKVYVNTGRDEYYLIRDKRDDSLRDYCDHSKTHGEFFFANVKHWHFDERGNVCLFI